MRSRNAVSPNFFTAYFPDAAWTMAVYCGFGLLFCKDARVHFPASLGVSFLISLLVLHLGFLWFHKTKKGFADVL